MNGLRSSKCCWWTLLGELMRQKKCRDFSHLNKHIPKMQIDMLKMHQHPCPILTHCKSRTNELPFENQKHLQL